MDPKDLYETRIRFAQARDQVMGSLMNLIDTEDNLQPYWDAMMTLEGFHGAHIEIQKTVLGLAKLKFDEACDEYLKIVENKDGG